MANHIKEEGIRKKLKTMVARSLPKYFFVLITNGVDA